jgi:hypothetical protein
MSSKKTQAPETEEAQSDAQYIVVHLSAGPMAEGAIATKEEIGAGFDRYVKLGAIREATTEEIAFGGLLPPAPPAPVASPDAPAVETDGDGGEGNGEGDDNPDDPDGPKA